MNLNDVYCGDCLEVMRGFPSDSVDLIMTSPPYADARKHTYGGVPPDQYVEWFLPRAEEMKRVLKPSGSFVLNIKEGIYNGQRHAYVFDLVLSMRAGGWLWIDEFVWHKSSPFPGNFGIRLKDGWERLFHFACDNDIKFRRESVQVPARYKNGRPNGKLVPGDRVSRSSSHGSGFGKRADMMENRGMVYPSNVLYGASLCEEEATGHSAQFPLWIPTFFVKLFTDAGDIVLDPFCGSGTTMAAAQSLGRQWIGIDKDQSSVDLSRDRLNKTQPALIPA